MRQIQLGRVNDRFSGLVATRYFDGLRAVMSLLSARVPWLSRFRSSAILRLRQLVSRVIDHVPFWLRRRREWLQAGNVLGKNDDCDQHEAFKHPTEEHAAIGKDSDGSFSGESFGSARESGTKSGLEFFPGRRPFDEQARWLGPLKGGIGNGLDFGHCVFLV
jgi:hypothetical protein